MEVSTGKVSGLGKAPAHCQKYRVVYVDGNPADVRIMEEALLGASLPHTLSVISDGEEALTFFRKFNAHSSGSVPDLVFLDLRLRKVDGLDVIKYLKTASHLGAIPVVAFAMAAGPDRAAAYAQGANLCIEKPTTELASYMAMIQGIVDRFCPGGPRAPSGRAART